MQSLKVATWNIGGGKIIAGDGDVSKLASYSKDGFDHIVELLVTEAPDIIALQETHKNSNEDLVQRLSEVLGYPYFIHDSTSHSHIDTNFQLGHAVLSKYPLSNSLFNLFENPNLEVVWEDGSHARSFDKGYSTTTASVDRVELRVTVTHLVPFRRFGVDVQSEKGQKIISDVDKNIAREQAPWLVLGDFNINDSKVGSYFPTAFRGMHELDIEKPTTPRGNKYDHILFDGLELVEYRIITDVLTDHYPVVALFHVQ